MFISTVLKWWQKRSNKKAEKHPPCFLRVGLYFCPSEKHLYVARTPTLAKATQPKILKADTKLYFTLRTEKGRDNLVLHMAAAQPARKKSRGQQWNYATRSRTKRFNLRYINEGRAAQISEHTLPLAPLSSRPQDGAGAPTALRDSPPPRPSPPRWRTHLQSLGCALAPPTPPLHRLTAPPPPRPPCSSIGRCRRPSHRCNQWRERKKRCACGPALLTRAGPPTCPRSPEGLRPLAVGSVDAALEEEEEQEGRRGRSRRGPGRDPGRGPEGCGSHLGSDPWPQARPMPASQPDRHPGPCGRAGGQRDPDLTRARSHPSQGDSPPSSTPEDGREKK